MITIVVAFATPEKQVEITVNVSENCTVSEAIIFSDIGKQFPEINLSDRVVGIFGKRATLDTIVRAGDRIEIYRALQKDPKELRRIKLNYKKNNGAL